jgi:hypothetical protein
MTRHSALFVLFLSIGGCSVTTYHVGDKVYRDEDSAIAASAAANAAIVADVEVRKPVSGSAVVVLPSRKYLSSPNYGLFLNGAGNYSVRSIENSMHGLAKAFERSQAFEKITIRIVEGDIGTVVKDLAGHHTVVFLQVSSPTLSWWAVAKGNGEPRRIEVAPGLRGAKRFDALIAGAVALHQAL